MAKRVLEKRIVTVVRPRIRIGTDLSFGPGKMALLRMVGETRSISAAARALGMPYKRAWILIDTLNKGFGKPVVATAAGGRGGGGASLTELGEALLERYALLESRIIETTQAELSAIQGLLA